MLNMSLVRHSVTYISSYNLTANINQKNINPTIHNVALGIHVMNKKTTSKSAHASPQRLVTFTVLLYQ